MSRHVLVTSLAVLAFVISDVSGFGNAVFSTNEVKACVDMMPSHGAAAMTSNCPITVDVPPMYTPGQSLTVTLRSTDNSTFRGFMLQARRVDTMERVGEFVAASGTKQNCMNTGGKALSHDSATDKSKLAITWTAPNPGVGDIKFLFTVVKVKSEFWVNQTSVTMRQSDLTNLMPIDTSQCGRMFGCYRYPAACTTDCDVIVTWRKDGDKYVNFEVDGRVPQASYYISVGFSNDDKMGSDSVVDCMHNASHGWIQMSYNRGRTNTPLIQKTLGLDTTKSVVMYKDSRLRCQFTRYISLSYIPTTTTVSGSTAQPGSSEDDLVVSLDQPYRLLIARGEVSSSGSKLKHKQIKVSAEAISVTTDVIGDVGTLSEKNLVKVHGAMMILAWICCVSIAILMPGHYKKAWSGKECLDKPLWFRIHQLLMVLAFLLTIIAFIIIFVSVGGYAGDYEYPAKAHPPLGIVVTCLVVINPIMAFFRPHPDASKRPIFNKLHFLVGESAHICSVAAVFIALYMVPTADWVRWVMVAFIVWIVFIKVTLLLLDCRKKLSTREMYEMNAVTNPEDNEAKQPENKSSAIKTFIFFIHVLAVIGFGVALIVGII